MGASIFLGRDPILRHPAETMRHLFLTVLAITLTGVSLSSSMADTIPLFIGTNTAKPDQPGSRGIYSTQFNPETGAMTEAKLAGEVSNPTFLTLHPSKPWLYAASEQYGPKGGSVSAWKVEETGGLTPINQVSSGGRGAVFVSVDPKNKLVLATNFGSSSIVSFPIGEDGALKEAVSVVERVGSGPDPEAQKQPKPHSIYPHPTADLAIVADLGTDEVAVYGIDPATGALSDEPVTSAKATNAGAGPRHVAVSPKGDRLYVVNELDSTVSQFDLDVSAPSLNEIDQVKIGEAGAGWASEIRLHPSGHYLYAAARKPNALTAYKVDADSGSVTPIQTIDAGGEVARNFEVDPTGKFLLVANNKSDRISVFAIDPANGKLTRQSELDLEVSRPACVRFYRPDR